MTKYFSVDQANRTLPLVKRIVADIVQEYRVWKEHVFQYELSAAGSQAHRGESPGQVALREQVDASARKINAYMDELARIGCVFKGFDEGLVDFYHQLDGRDVLLCWKHGEDEIAHWHEVDAGFAGRQPITAGRLM
jgi:hypothetical protein